ncbi:MAG: SemiSWEET transporter [Sphingorhabdus sp.]
MIVPDSIQIVGILAAIASTISFVPQAWKIISTRDTEGLSRRMYALTVIGFALWLTYGIGKNDWALIVPNSLCLAMAMFIFAMLMMPQKQRQAVADAIQPNTSAKS